MVQLPQSRRALESLGLKLKFRPFLARANARSRRQSSGKRVAQNARRVGGADPARGGLGAGGLRRNLASHDGELSFQPLHCGAGLIHAKLVRLWVDLEEHLAFLDLLVVEHIKLDDAAADLRGHIDDVRLNKGVVRAWSLIGPARYEHSSHDDAYQHDEADESAE